MGRQAHVAVLKLPDPKDDFDVFLHAQQRRVLYRMAHHLSMVKQYWARERREAQGAWETRGRVSGYTGTVQRWYDEE